MEGTRLVFFSNLSAEEHLRSSARYYATLQIRTYVIDMEDNIRGIYYQDSRRQVRREQLSKILTTTQLPMAEHIDKKSQMANASDRSLREEDQMSKTSFAEKDGNESTESTQIPLIKMKGLKKYSNHVTDGRAH
jgi:hypothetical protein